MDLPLIHLPLATDFYHNNGTYAKDYVALKSIWIILEDFVNGLLSTDSFRKNWTLNVFDNINSWFEILNQVKLDRPG